MKFQAIRGMPDITPEVVRYWQHCEGLVSRCAEMFGFEEIRMPILESTQLFKRGVGEVTDIVEKEMYVFEDRNGDSLALRPEGTAGCVRAALEHGLIHNQLRKLWYHGPMYRHERPQKGRLRQFFQTGFEVFGTDSPLADAELMVMIYELFSVLGLNQVIQLQINTIGTLEERLAYRAALLAYLTPLRAQLDEDSQRRLETNPLRILDSKVPETQTLLKEAPRLMDTLGEASRQRFQQLCQLLEAAGVPYQIQPNLVRGLDYYTHTVFEYVTTTLGAQGTVCAGGRYDGLVALLGGAQTPAVGCAIGMDRVVLMLQDATAEPPKGADLMRCAVIYEASCEASLFGWVSRERLRHPHLQWIMNPKGGDFKKQFQRAHKEGAHYAVIVTADRWDRQTVEIKALQTDSPQPGIEMPLAEMGAWLSAKAKTPSENPSV